MTAAEVVKLVEGFGPIFAAHWCVLLIYDVPDPSFQPYFSLSLKQYIHRQQKKVIFPIASEQKVPYL